MKPVNDLDWGLFSNPPEVLPFNDTRVHERGADCWCLPEVNEDEVIVHNSDDGREMYVEGRRKPH